jgi:hypothetical protein
MVTLAACGGTQRDDCRAPSAGQDCFSHCMSCGLQDDGPCRARCASAAKNAGTSQGQRVAPAAKSTEVPLASDSLASPKQDEPRAQPAGRFPPPEVSPPHPRSAEQGDGKWVRVGQPGDRASEGEAVMYQTTVHPHPVSRFDSVIVVAIDLAKTELHFMPGSNDPNVDGLDHPAGLVPASHRDGLLAVMNGGFQPKHGRWGMMLGGRELVPPRDIGCTVALYAEGRVRVRSWPAISSDLARLRAYRQTPPCMVEDAKLHPRLEAHDEKPWGGAVPGEKTRRRSAIGVDASGRVLFYGFGVEVGPELLSRGMMHVGAVEAAELDINWSWTRFLLFGTRDGNLRATSTLVPQMTHTKTGYIERRDERDFFYVRRK